MPRYFFDFVDDGRLTADGVGTELGDLDEAQTEAVTTLAEIVRSQLRNQAERTFSLRVREEDGPPLLTASVTLRIEQQRR